MTEADTLVLAKIGSGDDCSLCIVMLGHDRVSRWAAANVFGFRRPTNL